MIIPLETAC